METRIQKYKNYRAELIKEGSTTIDVHEKVKTTTALPIKEVMDSASLDNVHNNFYKNQQRLRIIQFSLLVAILVGLIAGLIIFGIYAFGR